MVSLKSFTLNINNNEITDIPTLGALYQISGLTNIYITLFNFTTVDKSFFDFVNYLPNIDEF